MKKTNSLIVNLLFFTLLLAACNTGEEPPSIEVVDDSLAVLTSEPTEADVTQTYAGKVPAPEFPDGLDWLNTEQPLTLAGLRGKVVLLDFWTYGCINCMHIIPDLKRLEEKYADELVVIGVHSAKFENEGETENIRRIILRYELEHPVINDRDFLVWNQYGARAWPTLVLIDPDGKVLGYHSGEGVYEPFDEVIGGMVEEFDALGRIDRRPLDLSLEMEKQIDSPLLFPGKVLADPEGGRLFISDSNHNRLVITDLSGRVLDVVGNGQPRLGDGDFATASFFRPQGLTLADGNTLYVADTENHAIRKVDLLARQVETVAGTGRQEFMIGSSGPAQSTALNSPWDVLYHDGRVYIAMAGQHQIWYYDVAGDQVMLHAGSGREALTDGRLLDGALNQPSGLATDGQLLYVADSEASAIRTAGFSPDGELQTLVGTGLFDFGDVDGQGEAVRLQHPLGVAYHDGQLYVADTYNSKIKRVDPLTKESITFLGGNEAGWRDGRQALFDEPGGVSIGQGKLYIADTNNHVIRVADLQTGLVETVVLVDMAGLLTRQPAGALYTGKTVTTEPQIVAAGPGTIRLDVTLPDGYKLNDLAPFMVDWTGTGDQIQIPDEAASMHLIQPAFPLSIDATFQPGTGQLTGELVIYYCDDEAESLCFIDRVRLVVPVTVAGEGAHTLFISHEVPLPDAN